MRDKRIKNILMAAALAACFLIAGTMDYNDAVAQQQHRAEFYGQ